jgi:hypothetical protein
LTHFAAHCEDFSHDAINRYLRGERMTALPVWENVRDSVVTTSAVARTAVMHMA